MQHTMMRKGFSLLLVLALALSLFAGLSLTASAADVIWKESPTGYTKASDVQYVTVSGKIANWGVREETATFLTSYAESYYTGNYSFETLSGKQGNANTASTPSSDLYKALQSMLKSKQTSTTSYAGTRDLYKYTDCMVGNYSNISSFYSGRKLKGAWDSGSTWNREHTWPNSKISGNGENDIMMLRPTSVQENSDRGNKAYGEGSSCYDPNVEATPNGFNVRGDCARIILYVYVRWGETSDVLNNMWGSSGVMESLDTLLKWMKEDPVDTWEMGRNDAVQSITGVRNVFVDYPEFAWLLFKQTVPADYPTPSNGGEQPVHEHECALAEEIPATCTEPGVKEHLFCNGCGKAFSLEQWNETHTLVEISAEELVIPASGHDWDEPTYEWRGDYAEVTATRVCKNDESHVETETVQTTAEETLAPTVEAEGVMTYTAVFQNPAFGTQTETDTIPKLDPTDPCADGHDWGEPEYVWSDDFGTCNASHRCARCQELEGELAHATSEVTLAPTVEADGVMTYTAVFQNPAFETQTKTDTIPKLTPAVENPFEDVEEGKFFYDAVLWAVNHEPQITNGTDATHFAPGAECTRGQVVTFLWRAYGQPEPTSTENPFEDVAEGKFYYKAVLWAVEMEITNGVDATHFGPDATCTRGQVVTFLWRAAGKPSATVSVEPGENETPIVPFNPDGGDVECPFEDVVEGAFYYDAMLWAVANEVTNGTSATTFSPGATCTRGQVVTFLYRAVEE